MARKDASLETSMEALGLMRKEIVLPNLENQLSHKEVDMLSCTIVVPRHTPSILSFVGE